MEFRFASVEELLQPEVHEKCLDKCPRKCERTVYQAMVQQVLPLRMNKSVHSTDTYYIGIELEHSALRDGGIITMTEVTKYTFTDLVNNIGGTLGVFIGGTMMTIAQVILFFVVYGCEKLALFAHQQ